jgi:hypothetical protein
LCLWKSFVGLYLRMLLCLLCHQVWLSQLRAAQWCVWRIAGSDASRRHRCIAEKRLLSWPTSASAWRCAPSR